MNKSRQLLFALGIFSLSVPVRADPVELEFVVNLKTGERGMANQYDKLDLGESSGRYVAALRQSGKVTSKGLLEGASVLDWGFHEVPTEKAAATGQNEAEPNGGGPAIWYLLFRQVTSSPCDFKCISSMFLSHMAPLCLSSSVSGRLSTQAEA